jgi:CRP/FNR family transcriptional regulator, cyclic AMP receptor protein
VAATDDTVDVLGRLSLFADLSLPDLEAVAHTLGEAAFPADTRVLRRDLSGAAFYVIRDGEAMVSIEGRELARLGRGDFFGEISVLTGQPPAADVLATTLLRCFTLPGAEVEQFLLGYPTVMLRMLQAEARRLRVANTWRG